MVRRLLALALAAMTALALSACGDDEEEDDLAGTGGADTAVVALERAAG